MAHAICVEMPDLPPQYVANLPGMGELRFIRDSLSKMPRPSELILKALNALQPSIAPFHTILKVLDVIQAIVNCIKSIKDAVQQMNPRKVTECLEKLYMALAALLPLFPPFSYVRMVVDIVVLVRFLVADIVSVLGMIDSQISKVKAAIDKGMATNNAELIAIANCARRDINQTTEGILTIFSAIGKVVGIVLDIMDVISALLPAEQQKQLQDARALIMEADAATDEISVSEFPPLHMMYVTGVNFMQVLMFIEQIGRIICGLQPLSDFEWPELTFVNPGT